MKFNKILAFPLAIAIAFGSFTAAHAQTAAPIVAIQLATSGLTSPLVAGGDDATVARLLLDTTGSTEAVRISSLPFILASANGAVASDLNNCEVYNEADINDSISEDVTLANGLNNIDFDSSVTIAANTIATFALRCDVDADLVEAGTYTFSMNTANVSAVGETSGTPALVVVRGAAVVNPPVYVPGLPTTGASSQASTSFAVIFGALAVAGLGLSLMRKAHTERA